MRKNRDRIEAIIYWPLKSGRSVSESDAFGRDFEHNKDSRGADILTGTVLCAAIPLSLMQAMSWSRISLLMELMFMLAKC